MLFAADILKHNQYLPDKLRDVLLYKWFQCKI